MSSHFLTLAPFAFVVLWSTGYITAKFALPDAEPMSFLAWRYALAAVIMAVIAARRNQSTATP